ncbi:MAG: type IV toxin-antitoxin system AbiEi family antitoxin domain-containing protein [Planctomycetota bacterium]|jgi:hypothetical protein
MNKINKLLKNISKDSIVIQSWLNKQGISRQLAYRYLKSGWLERVGRGAYKRAGDNPKWFSGLNALQWQLNYKVFAGAHTALNLKGFGHYLALGKEENIYLFGNGKQNLASWFLQQDWKVNIHYFCPNLFHKYLKRSYTSIEAEGLPIFISSPERAILEVFYLADNNEDIDYSLQLMEGLSTLRPDLVQELLENCRHIKVKRLFLWAAETVGHSWFEQLNIDNISLGKGKRMAYKCGKLHPQYLITVPEKRELPNV